MTSITIDPGKCVGCGVCVRDCLPRNLDLVGGKAVPQAPCFMCGHCIAICPTGAVASNLPEYDMADVTPWTPQARLDPEIFLQAVKCRRSIRQFQPRDLPRDLLLRVLEAGRFTETGGNRQDLRYLVLHDELAAFKPRLWESWRSYLEGGGLAGYKGSGVAEHLYDRWKADPEDDGLFFGAPVLLVVAGADPVCAGLALANIEHMAVGHGLGMIVMGYLRRVLEYDPALLEAYPLEGRKVLACALLGWPGVQYRRSVPRKPADIQWR